jgi:SPP1 gp7 family putative phage head morphogenesis protein
MGTLDFDGVERIMVQAIFTGWALGAGNAIRDVKRATARSRFAEPAWWKEFEAEYKSATKTQPFGAGFETLPPEEAIAWIQKRVALPLRRLEAALSVSRDYAADLTKDLVNAIADKIDANLVDYVKAGADMNEFLEGLDDVAGQVGLTDVDPFYWETVFRTNVQTAYGAGRYEGMRNPEVESAMGYYQYLTVGDSAVRPEHAALHGRVWPADDPAVSEFWPPNGWNCRCSMLPLTKDEIDAEGLDISDGAPEIDGEPVKPDDGFAGPPKMRFEVKA